MRIQGYAAAVFDSFPPIRLMMWTSPLSLRLRDAARRLGLSRALGRWIHRYGYEDRFGKALLAAVRPGDVVWDIGANVGLYSKQFLTTVGPSGKVVAFEPMFEAYEELMRTCADATTFAALNLAVGAVDGAVAMEVANSAIDPTNRVVANKPPVSENGRIVPLRSVRSLCEEHAEWFPNVIKIDVEGHEGAVIEGCGGLLADARLRVIGVEVHFGLLHSHGEDATPGQIESSLRAGGFLVRWTDPSHLIATKRS